ncbi:MAG: hypothetical protein ACK5WZ_06350 [Pseudobdellovibrionaceae bacterium]
METNLLKDLQLKNFCRVTGDLKLTKTQTNFSDLLITRDRELELQTQQWISQRCDLNTILQRYQNYDARLKDVSWPQHYPARILSGSGSGCSGNNIFMFFPNVLNQLPQNESEVFGLEFIDVWTNIFKSTIFAIAHRLFDKETLLQILPLKQNLEKTIYLAAVFHEIGHRCGPFQVSPRKLSHNYLDSQLLDIFGELSTDALLITKMPEFPEIIQFVVLQRLFWFGRTGFKHNPVSAEINTDNDCWLGSMLWERLSKNGTLIWKDEKLKINFNQTQKIFPKLISEIDELIRSDDTPTLQKNRVLCWMKSNVPYDKKFHLPKNFRSCLEAIQDIEEVPHFQPLYSYSFIEELTGAIQNEKFN